MKHAQILACNQEIGDKLVTTLQNSSFEDDIIEETKQYIKIDEISIELNADALTPISTTKIGEITLETLDINGDKASLWTFKYNSLAFIVCMISFIIFVILCIVCCIIQYKYWNKAKEKHNNKNPVRPQLELVQNNSYKKYNPGSVNYEDEDIEDMYINDRRDTTTKDHTDKKHKNIVKGDGVLDAMDQDDGYQNWGHTQILQWILLLKDGLFVQYKDILSQYLAQRNMVGSELMYIQMDDVNNFGIDHYKHVRKLYLHIKTLTNVEGNRDSD